MLQFVAMKSKKKTTKISQTGKKFHSIVRFDNFLTDCWDSEIIFEYYKYLVYLPNVRYLNIENGMRQQ